MSMTSEERLKKIQELRAEKDEIAREIDQTRRHAQWHENKLLRLVKKLMGLDAEQGAMIFKHLLAKETENDG